MNKEDRITQINYKLFALRKYVQFLKRFENISVEELTESEMKQGAIERYFQLAIEIVLDITSQLIAEYRFRMPEDYKDSIRILGEEGVLSKKFTQELIPMAGFRNILVHDYLKIDYHKVADKLNNRLGDFEKFAKAVAKYLR